MTKLIKLSEVKSGLVCVPGIDDGSGLFRVGVALFVIGLLIAVVLLESGLLLIGAGVSSLGVTLIAFGYLTGLFHHIERRLIHIQIGALGPSAYYEGQTPTSTQPTVSE